VTKMRSAGIQCNRKRPGRMDKLKPKDQVLLNLGLSNLVGQITSIWFACCQKNGHEIHEALILTR
jgi:hypothetical protein